MNISSLASRIQTPAQIRFRAKEMISTNDTADHFYGLSPGAEKRNVDSLELSSQSDPFAQRLAKEVANLDRTWVKGDEKKRDTLHRCALSVAAGCIGGPVGAALEAGQGIPEKDRSRAMGGLSELISKAGAQAQGLAEACVPDSWVQGQDSNHTDSEWGLGQKLGLLSDGRADIVGEVQTWRRLPGKPIDIQQVDADIVKQEEFKNRADGWLTTNKTPYDLHGAEVAFLAPAEGKLQEFRGYLAATDDEMCARFGLDHGGIDFNYNSLKSGMRLHPDDANYAHPLEIG